MEDAAWGSLACSLPGPVRQAALAAAALSEGRSVIALTGPFLGALDFRDEILRAASLRHHVHVPASSTVSPHQALAEALDGVDLELLLLGGSVDVPEGRLVYVDRLDDGQASRWHDLLVRYAAAAHAGLAAGRDMPPILACHRGRADGLPPRTDALLEVLHVHRHLDDLDVRCFVRAQAGGARDPRATWREHVLPELAGPDLALVIHLWDACLQGPDVIVLRCREVARERGWDAASRASLGASPAERLRDELDGVAFRRGDAAECQSHLAYAVTVGREWEVERRLWRGLTGMMLPFLDGVRLALCERFEEVLGRGWSTRWVSPLNDEELRLVRESHLHCQLGHLEMVARSASALPDRPVLQGIARRARELRNALAHYRPVSFSAFEQLLDFVRRGGFRISVR